MRVELSNSVLGVGRNYNRAQKVTVYGNRGAAAIPELGTEEERRWRRWERRSVMGTAMFKLGKGDGRQCLAS